MSEEKKPTEAIESLRSSQQQLDMDGIIVGVSRQALEEVLAYIDRRSPPSPSGRDLGSPQAGLGGLGETPSDAVKRVARAIFNARRIEDGFASRNYDDLSPSIKGRMLRDARAAIAAMVASPSPWREMEAEGFKSMGLASTINGPCVRIDFDTTREAEKFMADLRPFLPEPPSEGLNAGPPEAEGRRTTPSPPSEGGGK